MKKLLIAALIAANLAGCGQPLNVNGKVYPTYGFINSDTQKSEKMCYEVSVGNIVWSIILIETIVAPIYFIGFSLFNPIGFGTNGECGIDSRVKP